ncbi:MAG: phosphoribosylformylglycinamidine synthase subunit PurS [Thermodesulfobacteriota bacterium]
MIQAKVYVTLKKAVLDPQGKAVHNSLLSLGFEQVKEVRVGKFIELSLAVSDEKEATALLNEMSRKLLANIVIEDFSFELQQT